MHAFPLVPSTYLFIQHKLSTSTPQNIHAFLLIPSTHTSWKHPHLTHDWKIVNFISPGMAQLVERLELGFDRNQWLQITRFPWSSHILRSRMLRLWRLRAVISSVGTIQAAEGKPVQGELRSPERCWPMAHGGREGVIFPLLSDRSGCEADNISAGSDTRLAWNLGICCRRVRSTPRIEHRDGPLLQEVVPVCKVGSKASDAVHQTRCVKFFYLYQ